MSNLSHRTNCEFIDFYHCKKNFQDMSIRGTKRLIWQNLKCTYEWGALWSRFSGLCVLGGMLTAGDLRCLFLRSVRLTYLVMYVRMQIVYICLKLRYALFKWGNNHAICETIGFNKVKVNWFFYKWRMMIHLFLKNMNWGCLCLWDFELLWFSLMLWALSWTLPVTSQHDFSLLFLLTRLPFFFFATVVNDCVTTSVTWYTPCWSSFSFLIMWGADC